MTNSLPLRKIIFVDDDNATNQFHKMLAKSMNLATEIEIYETAEEVLKAYSEPKEGRTFPQLFFVDIGLPKMTGHDLGIQIRKLPEFDATQSGICFLTASKDIRDVVVADSNEFDHYYWKPMNKRKVHQVLREVFNMKLQEPKS